RGVQVHHYATAKITPEFGGRRVGLGVETNYPWSGDVKVTVSETDNQPWELRLRIPNWTNAVKLAVNDAPVALEQGAEYATVNRTWQPGDVVTLSLAMTPELVAAHPRVDP